MESTPARPSAPQSTQPSSTRPERSSPNRRASQSATSEDSQTVYLNRPSSSESLPKTEDRQKQVSPRLKRSATDKEPRKCWICFSDETEDSPTSSAWRSPCPCALTAHEACLLDWVADLEAPNRKRGGPPSKIQCPQCKGEIIVARPRSYVVDGVRAVEHATGRLVVPVILVTLAGTVITGCWMHGFSTVYLIFGPEDADRLFGIDNSKSMSSNWGLSLPFIPLVLVLSRTTLADGLLPILPIFYLINKVPTHSSSNLWPPSAAMAVSCLPYMRSIYNELYKRIFQHREKAWLKEIQPRSGETNEGEGEGEGDQGAAAQNEEQAEELLNFELGVEVEIIEDEVEQPPVAEDQAGGNAQAQADGQANREGVQPQNNIIVSTSRLADTIIGALLFPTISAAMGGLIKLALPRSWTTPPLGSWDRRSPGLLQSRWGRSLVGGCIFVVMKDSLLLYSRYRLAQLHRHRRIVDYDAKKAKAAGNGRGEGKV